MDFGHFWETYVSTIVWIFEIRNFDIREEMDAKDLTASTACGKQAITIQGVEHSSYIGDQREADTCRAPDGDDKHQVITQGVEHASIPCD